MPNQYSKPRPTPHCRVLPPGEFSGVILEPLRCPSSNQDRVHVRSVLYKEHLLLGLATFAKLRYHCADRGSHASLWILELFGLQFNSMMPVALLIYGDSLMTVAGYKQSYEHRRWQTIRRPPSRRREAITNYITSITSSRASCYQFNFL